MQRWLADVLLGCGILIFCIVNVLYSFTIGDGGADYVLAAPDTYIELWMAVLGILAVLLIIRALKRRDPTRENDPIWNRLRIATVILTVLYLVALEKVGFIISTIVVEFLLCALYCRGLRPKQNGKALVKQIILWAIIAIVTTLVCYILFDKILNVILPRFDLW